MRRKIRRLKIWLTTRLCRRSEVRLKGGICCRWDDREESGGSIWLLRGLNGWENSWHGLRVSLWLQRGIRGRVHQWLH